MNLFESDDYRDYLVFQLEKADRGFRKKDMAEALNVQSSMISQVLAKKIHLSPEQAESANEYLAHSEIESEYFIHQVMYERAGTEKLRERFRQKIKEIRNKNKDIKVRIRGQDLVDDKDKSRYYSSAVYGIVHVLVGISELNSREKLASAIGLPLKEVTEILSEMTQMGLIKETQGEIEVLVPSVHLGKDSDLIRIFHQNYRYWTLSHLRTLGKEDLHFSSALALSKKDAEKIKEDILKMIGDSMKVIKDSPSEVCWSFCLDFYRVDKFR